MQAKLGQLRSHIMENVIEEDSHQREERLKNEKLAKELAIRK